MMFKQFNILLFSLFDRVMTDVSNYI